MSKPVKWSLSEDRTKLVYESPEDPTVRVEYTASQVEGMLTALARIREAMRPTRPMRDPRPGEQLETARLGRWWIQPNPPSSGVALAILHPGYGWVALPLDQQGTDLLSEMIRRFRPTPETPIPREKMH